MQLSEMMRMQLQRSEAADGLIARAEELEQEVQQRRAEIDNLETELASLKKSEAMESKQADDWATEAKRLRKLLEDHGIAYD